MRSQAVCDDASPPPEILVCGASLKEASIISREIGITLVQAGNLSVSPTIQVCSTFEFTNLQHDFHCVRTGFT